MDVGLRLLALHVFCEACTARARITADNLDAVHGFALCHLKPTIEAEVLLNGRRRFADVLVTKE